MGQLNKALRTVLPSDVWGEILSALDLEKRDTHGYLALVHSSWRRCIRQWQIVRTEKFIAVCERRNARPVDPDDLFPFPRLAASFFAKHSFIPFTPPTMEPLHRLIQELNPVGFGLSYRTLRAAQQACRSPGSLSTQADVLGGMAIKLARYAYFELAFAILDRISIPGTRDTILHSIAIKYTQLGCLQEAYQVVHQISIGRIAGTLREMESTMVDHKKAFCQKARSFFRL